MSAADQKEGFAGKPPTEPPIRIYGPRAKVPEGVRANVTSKAASAAPPDNADLADVAPFAALSPFNTGPVSVYLGLKRREARIMECGWQYAKVYKAHADAGGLPTVRHARWAREGFEAKEARRFPMGRGAKPEYSLWENARLGYQPARLLIYIPMYVEALLRTPAARTALVKLRVLHRRAAKDGQSLVLFDYDGYDHRAKKSPTYADVICADRKMGHAFVLAMILEDQLMGAVHEAARRLLPGRVLGPRDLPTDFAFLRKSELLSKFSVGGARLYLRPQFLNRLADRLLEVLLPGGPARVPWETGTIVMFGRECREGRMTAHYGDAGTSYKYSGRDHTPSPWSADPTGVLAECVYLVWQATGQKCNYMLLNYYEDGRQALNPHSDSESDLISGSYICSVSVGAARAFELEPKTKAGGAGLRPPAGSITLPHGSLLVMGGLCQKVYKHSVPVDKAVFAPRINLTLREVRRSG